MLQVNGVIKNTPFPFFVIDRQFNILSLSEESFHQFPSVDNFLELVDFGSRKKAEHFMKPVFAKTKIELNLISKQEHLTLFDIYTQWEGKDYLYVFCIEKQESIQQIHEIIKKLENQLENEDLSMQEKQAQLETTLQKMEQVVMEHDNLSNFGKLASSIANDLKRPLVSIRGFLQLIKPQLIDKGKVHLVDAALDEINHANRLIYQYLSTTKPEPPNRRRVNLQKILMNVLVSSEHQASNINCEIKYVKQHILPVISVDEKQIRQVLLNLIINSMEAIEAGPNRGRGKILITTDHTGPTIEISIRDNGKGMDQQTLKRIFTPFFTTKEKGAGIGLAVSMKIIQNHDGIIAVESETGRGTTFTIVIPAN